LRKGDAEKLCQPVGGPALTHVVGPFERGDRFGVSEGASHAVGGKL
jgi:hypothetical protein